MKKIQLLMSAALVVLLMSCGDDEPNYQIQRDPVDLGLSVKWAPMNIGAAKPEAMGGLYGWADSLGLHKPISDEYPIEVSFRMNEGKEITTVKWNSPYFGGKSPRANISGSEYDAARYMWNTDWRVPTQEEWQELIDKCDWELISMEGATGQVYRVTGPNGNSIIIPLGGIRTTDMYEERGALGHYWTSNLLLLSEQGAYNYSSTVACAAWSVTINPHAQDQIVFEPQVRCFSLSYRPVYAK